MPMVKKGSSFDRATGNVRVHGLDGVITRLQTFNKNMEDVSPFLRVVAKLFTLMETQRAMNAGAAPEFGIANQWAPDSAATMGWRKWVGANEDTPPLHAFGFLADAMMQPVYINSSAKAIELAINPAAHGASSMTTPDDKPYVKHGTNYASFHQTGAGNNPVRAIVTLTPEFLLEVRNLAREYVDGIKPVVGNDQNPVFAERNMTRKIKAKHHVGGTTKGVKGNHDPIHIAGTKSSREQWGAYRQSMGFDTQGTATSVEQAAAQAAQRQQIYNETDVNMA